MSAGKSGMATAVELLGGFGVAEAADQDELFADADDAPGALPPVPVPARRGAHRPKGARNRSTEEWKRFFLGRFQSPLIGCGEIYSRPAEELARLLCLTRVVDELVPGQVAVKELLYRSGEREGEVKGYLVWDLEAAFRLQLEAMATALPYVHQKQPLAIETKGEQRGLLVVGDFAVSVAAGDGLALPLSEENQGVIDVESVKSDGEQSDGDAKPLGGHENG